MSPAKRSRSAGQSTRKKIRLSNTAAPKLDSEQNEQEEKPEEREETGEWDERIRSEDWIEPSPTEPSKWRCRACAPHTSKEYASSSLKGHLESSMHERRASSSISQNAGLKFSELLSEFNLSPCVAEKLVQRVKDIFLDSKVSQELHVNGEEMKSITMNLLAPDIKSKLANKLCTCKFSIIAEKLTDISSAKVYSIVVRYFDEDHGRNENGLWKLSSMEDRNDQEAMKEHLYKDIKESFDEFNIPIGNIVGFGSHGCDVIMNGENSVASRFEKDHPGIVISKCINHSIHLCASEAAKSLPPSCEQLARMVIFSLKDEIDGSPLSDSVDVRQAFLDLEPHEILHPSQARFLTVSAVSDCMLEHWEKLEKLYNSMPEPGIFRGPVLGFLRDEYNKLYYQFIQSVSHKLDDFNAFFESSHENITELNTKAEDICRYIFKCFLERNYVMMTRLQDINPLAADKQLLGAQLYLGKDVLAKIEEIKKESKDSRVLIDNFLLKCQEFLQLLATAMKERFPFGNSVMTQIEVLSPKYMRIEPARTLSILELAAALPLSISSSCPRRRQAFNDQWRELRRKIKDYPEEIANENRPDVFWGKIYIKAKRDDNKELIDLARFALDAMVSIPHTNADYARMFKEINRTWTGSRNQTASYCEAKLRIALSRGDLKRDGTGRIILQESTGTINGAVDSSIVQVEPEPIASTSRG